jgi:hypothetical protein
MNEEYKIRSGGFNEIKKQMIIRAVPIGLLALGAGLGISFFNPNSQDIQLDTLPIVILIGLGALSFGLYKGINRQRILFESYKLTISENEMRREQFNTPTINLVFSDINSILKNTNGSLTVKGRTKLDIIGIPAQIDNLEQLEKSLNQIRTITQVNKTSVSQKYLIPFVIITLASMATVYISTNKILVGIAGTTVTVILVWSFIQTQRSKNIDSKTKKSSYFTIFVLISIIAVTIMKIIAY